MSNYHRKLNLVADAQKKSLFLFGPRQTGKTWLLKHTFPQARSYNLLQADVFLKLSQRPQRLREELIAAKTQKGSVVIVDEIQKLPQLLDEVQYLIDEFGIHFILTGSSARKLKHGAANLLGGRARLRNLFPLVSAEIPHADLLRILNYGALPFIYDSDEPWDDLQSYIGTYLQEEIQAEGLTRKIENFSRFLQTASLYNGELLNYANVASDAAVPARTVAEYFIILQDTLLGTLLEPFEKTRKRKAITTAKFYFFDVGVCNALAGRQKIMQKTELYGKALEHFIFTELRAYLSYQKDSRPLSFWRSSSGYEVDFLLGDECALEVKATEHVSERHFSGMNALSDDLTLKKKILICNEQHARQVGDVLVLPVNDFLQQLWAREL